jgi:hypothetical protein
MAKRTKTHKNKQSATVSNQVSTFLPLNVVSNIVFNMGLFILDCQNGESYTVLRMDDGQKKKYKRTNNDLQNIHIKLKIK